MDKSSNGRNVSFSFAEGVSKGEVIIREVSSVNELPVKPPRKIDLEGVIGAPYEFLSKRYNANDQIDQKRCHVLVNREKCAIVLVICENDEYNKGTVVGELGLHPKFSEFGINAKKMWTPNELGQFFKMNRAYFPDMAENMSLVTTLNNFEAKIDSVVEKQKSEAGGFKDNYSAVVTSNLPGKFKVKMPLFKGKPAEEFECEFYASVNGRDIGLQIFSPAVVQAFEEIKNEVIDNEIAKIRDLTPEVAIIEQ